MKAVIKLDVPEWQIGQDVTVYFPDTMLKHGKCELLKEQDEQIKNRDESLEKAREEIKRLRGMLKKQEAEIAFLKTMQLQTVHNMSNEDIGNAVRNVLRL